MQCLITYFPRIVTFVEARGGKHLRVRAYKAAWLDPVSPSVSYQPEGKSPIASVKQVLYQNVLRVLRPNRSVFEQSEA